VGMRITRAGMLSTVQDEGRYGYMDFGISVSGAMDALAMHTANILVGNKRDEAVIEMTMQGLEAVFDSSAIIAITGANMHPQINGSPVPMYEAVRVAAGDTLTLGYAQSGLRAYLAFYKGLYLKKTLGSYSTNIKAGIGGYMGRALKAGDLLFFNTTEPCLANIEKYKAPLQARHPYFSGNCATVRVVLGLQSDYFTSEGINTFFTSEYKLTNDSDRMGIKLVGAPIAAHTGVDIVSDGMPEGGIQIPSSGMPIIMAADRQTTGGYAKIGAVISRDMPIIAQCKPGDSIRFEKISIRAAQRLYKRRLRLLSKMEKLWNKTT